MTDNNVQPTIQPQTITRLKLVTPMYPKASTAEQRIHFLIEEHQLMLASLQVLSADGRDVVEGLAKTILYGVELLSTKPTDNTPDN